MIDVFIIISLSFFISQMAVVAVTYSVMTNKRFMKWYYKKIMNIMGLISELEYDDEEY